MWTGGAENFDEHLDMTQNIVNPAWEAIDPTPNIHGLFKKFNQKFFQGKLAAVELEWSKRMYQCAGICYSRRSKFGMACVIRLSEPLLKLRSRKELVETLLHEMIHAYLFVLNIREANGGHGPNFLRLAHGINRQTGTNITVYHTFHDEVDFYKKHWWRCDGVCKARQPYYGYVKRVANRAPGPNDLWWKQHQQTCGGKFVKVKEPTPKKAVKPRKAPNNTSGPKGGVGGIMNRGTGTLVIRKPPATTTKSPPASKDIRQFFTPTSTPKAVPGNLSNVHGFGDLGTPSTSKPAGSGSNIHGFAVPGPSKRPSAFSGSGTALGGGGGDSGRKRSRLLDEFESGPKACERTIRQSSMRDEILELHPDEEIILLDDDYGDSTPPPPPPPATAEDGNEQPKCPICGEGFSEISVHIEDCLEKFENAEEETAQNPAEESCILIEPHIDTVEVSDSPVQPRATKLESPKKFSCPNCPKYFTEAEINAHLDDCLS